VAVGFTVAQLRLRRPWWGEARERAGGESEVSRGASDTGGVLRGVEAAFGRPGRQGGGVASAPASRCPSSAYWQR
jgi:hypothetical protein